MAENHRRRVRLALLGAPALAAALTLAPAARAGAQVANPSSDPTIESLRQQADAASSAYFAALAKYKELTGRINQLQAQLPLLRTAQANLARTAQHRAVAIYERSGSVQLGALVTSDDVLTAAREAHLLQTLNASDDHVISNLKKASDRLDAEERSLKSDQATASGALASLQAQGRDIDAKLQAAEARQRQIEAAAAAAAAAASASATPAGGGGGGGGGAGPASSGPPPNYAPTGGQNPHHDDPFLSCVRGYESGGNYGAVNPAGPYLGAYQFLQSTWDSAANHSGRTNLIGVPPNRASAYDQDDMAWNLYQWQGKGPWAGDPC